MKVHVSPGSRRAPEALADFVLQQSNWDDFGFKTSYQLYNFSYEPKGLIGSLKILKRNQQTSQDSLLPVGALTALGDDFCSLGQSLDYYERLAAFPKQTRDQILVFFRDAVFDPDHAKRFEQEEGWRSSVIRDLDLKSYTPLARTLLERDYSSLPDIGLAMSFLVAGWQKPFRLDFAADLEGRAPVYQAAERLPERIAVIVGRNGSGKSTLLSRLARVLYASQADRRDSEIAKLGTIEPIGIGFSRVITVACSAFDTFQVPGNNDEEKRQIIKDVRAGTGRYVFAGLRDIARELEEVLESVEPADATEALGSLDRQKHTYLKSVDRLANEFAETLRSTVNSDRYALLLKALRFLLADPSFSTVSNPSPEVLLTTDPKTAFLRWSTGHKISMHAIATLVAHVQPKSIVLMDEPESHLHPPLLAALMHAVRVILQRYDAFAVIATHSPVVVQETLGRHVSIVSRVDQVVTILPPRMETYGESIGEITDELFGLHPGATDYHQILRTLVEAGLSEQQIDERFERGLSLQARAYVMSLIASRAA